jgi:mRNA interferase MazF
MVTRGYIPDMGHLIKIDFDPQSGHEQTGWRPALVLTPSSYNGPAGLAVVAPVTNQKKGYPFEIELPAGSAITGVILADAIKSLDWRSRNARYAGVVPSLVLKAVREKLMLLLELERLQES